MSNDFSALPGRELVSGALRDLEDERESMEAPLVSIGHRGCGD